jgi:hypothetical protein
VNPGELVFMSLLTVVLLAAAGYFGWRQVQTLRRRDQDTPEERRFTVPQAWRRLFCCGLMGVLAVLLVGGLFLDARYRELSQQHRQVEGEHAPTQEYEEFAKLMAWHTVAVLVGVFALLLLAAVDMWAIARFGVGQRRRLHAEHRAVLEEEIARLRRQRNGHDG